MHPDVSPAPRCGICGGDLRIVTRAHPGYVVDDGPYVIAHCSRCGAAQAVTDIDPRPIYDRIYADPARVPGYARYREYAALVERSATPLDALAEQEDMYWAVRQVADQRGWRTGRPVLDVGAGLGYVTAALVAAGVDATGLDVSTEAIMRARERFGDRFVAGELGAMAASGRAYDGVLLLEMLEHVPEPWPVLRAAWRLVAAGGALVVTTPNKSAWPRDVWWHTDPPPVHLWWFTEDAMRHVATALGAELAFVDFTGYDAGWRTVQRAPAPAQITVAPVLGRPGEGGGLSPWRPGRVERWRVRAVHAAARLGVLPGHVVWTGARRPTMAAVFTRARNSI
jgi:SAM-dependent methyltransferase